MARRLQSFRFNESKYERPEQKWVCGHAKDGRPCQIGPDDRGRCRATYECTPIQKGDRWQCTRPTQWGGKCEQGPLPDGTCCNPIPKCQPDRSVRSKRGMTVLGVSALTLGLVLFLLGGPGFEDVRESVVSSGDLSAHHGAIEDCSFCHVSETGPAQGASPDQSALCLQCHESMDDDVRAPHGLSSDIRAAMTRELEADTTAGDRPFVLSLAALGPDVPTAEGGGPACATCHEEHRGRNVSLTEVSNLRCQGCHTVQFSSFSRGHPELDGPEPLETLPYGFDHGAHESEHFPDEDTEFACTSCHSPAPRPEADRRHAASMRTGDFQGMCADCHSEEIGRNGLVVLQLPGVDYEILEQGGVSVGTWPVDAGIDLVTPISPVMRTLLAADPELRDDLEMLEGVDLYFLPEDDPEINRAAGNVAWGVKRLFRDLLADGRDEMAARLERGLGAELTEAQAAALVDQRAGDERRPLEPGWLPALEAAQEAWLPGLAEEVRRRGAGAAPPLDVYEEYGEPASPTEDWLIDWDFTIRYLPEGHGDVFLRRLLEVSARASADGELAERVFGSLSDPEAPGSCGKCHSLEADRVTDPRGLWNEARVHAPPNALTRFDHGPHLVVECGTCHEVDPEGRFRPTPKRTCASCHTENRATQSCLNCHRYHAEGFTRTGEHPMMDPMSESPEAGTDDQAEGQGAPDDQGTPGDEGSGAPDDGG